MTSHPVLVQTSELSEVHRVSLLDVLDTVSFAEERPLMTVSPRLGRSLVTALLLTCVGAALVVMTSGSRESVPVVPEKRLAKASIESKPVLAHRLVVTPSGGDVARIEDARAVLGALPERERALSAAQSAMGVAEEIVGSVAKPKAKRKKQPGKRQRESAAGNAPPRRGEATPDRDVEIIEVIVESGKAAR